MMAYFRRPTDLASLVVFRILAGLLLSLELLYSLSLGDFAEYTTPLFHFTYQGFGWVKPFSRDGMIALYAATITAGFMVSAGLFYRIASVILFFGYTSLFLMEASQYVNHLYLYCLISFWLMLLPLHRNGSLDAKIFSQYRSDHLPLWILHLFQFQIGVVYFFAGVAKLHPDWISGRMMSLFLSGRGINYSFLPQVMSTAGLLFDLLIIPLMMWKKTRRFAFFTAAIFHMTNAGLFGLGSFPWFALMSLGLFFPADWPRTIPILRNLFGHGRYASATSRLTPAFLSLYVAVQLALPFRQHFYPHDAGWSEEGHNYSWRMKTRTKQSAVTYTVENIDTGHTWKINPSSYLTETQVKDLGGNPEFILQFAHYLRDKYRDKGMAVAVYAYARTSMNAYQYQTLIDPTRDLAREERGLFSYNWIMKPAFFASENTAGAGYKASRNERTTFPRNVQNDAAPGAPAQHL